MTENERINEFAIQKVKLENIENFINEFIIITQKEINVIIAKEILVAIKKFKDYLKTINC